jgi:phosphatidylglycerophosphatase A
MSSRPAPTLRGLVARWLAIWFGCGLSPWAPGTVGTLGAIPLHLLLCRMGVAAHAASVVVFCGLGVWAAQRHAEARGETDPQSVVIDEVAGTLIALGMVRSEGYLAGGAALLAFRVFDIWKPGPIRQLEHARPLGLGIMLDDLLAGLLAGAIVALAAAALG